MIRPGLIAELQEILRARNVRAFGCVVAAGESSNGPDAYRMRFGGYGNPTAYFTDFSRHPKIFEPTKDGRKSSAAGKWQATWTTWSDFLADVGQRDFSPESQDLFFAWCLRRARAVDAIKAGRFEEACRLCHGTWTSLPGGAEENSATKRARSTYLAAGGQIEGAKAAATEPSPTTEPTQEAPKMDPLTLSLIATFGGEILKLWPQVTKLFDPAVPVATRNVGLASSVLSTIVETAGKPDIQQALTAAKADPVLKQEITTAILTNPEVQAYLQVTLEGVKQAQDWSLKAQVADKPFWFNPTFIMSLLLLPMVYWIVGSVLVGGIKIPDAWPPALQFVAMLFGNEFTSEMRAGTVNLVIGLTLGGICGVFFGTTYANAKNADRRATDPQPIVKE